MLSRYRQVAVTELIKQASGGASGEGGEGISVEQSRKACVDLLKADLKRAEVQTHLPSATDHDDEHAAMQEVASIRAALFGEESPNDDPAQGGA